MRRPSGFGVRRRLTAGVATALILSVALSVTFYSLLATLQSPGDIGSPGSPGYDQRASAYLSWYESRSAYTQGYELGMVGAILFATALVVVIAPRLALVLSFLSLNVFFAWTSHLLSAVSQPLASEVSHIIGLQDGLIWRAFDLGIFTMYTQIVADFEGLALLALVTALIALLNRDKGRGKAMLLSLQVAAACVVILGFEIAAFDYGEFYLHVTDVQVMLHFAPWFNNADLLLSAVGLLAASSALLRQHRFRRPV